MKQTQVPPDVDHHQNLFSIVYSFEHQVADHPEELHRMAVV